MVDTPFGTHSRSVDAAHLLGRIHSFETLGTVDGPGTRFVIFMQGCQFRCRYCHNVDTWDVTTGRLYSVTDILTEILPYLPFIDASGGGVTVSGGEPMLQRQLVRVLFKSLNFQGIHTCLDTNGYVPPAFYDVELERLVQGTDLVLLDIKQMDEQKHLELTGVSNQDTLRFANYLHRRKRPVWVRHVVVPGYSDGIEDVRRLAEFVAPMENVERVELLAYHTLGAHKWQAMGLEYPLRGVEPPAAETMQELKSVLEAHGISAVV